MDQKRLAHAAAAAPRYTSYPTAPHFSATVGPEVAGGWLEALDPAEVLSLYLHVPFCREICWYCGCHTFATRQDGPVLDYAAALAAEIDLVAARTPARAVTRIAWGGGTPNVLAPAVFADLASRLRARFDLSSLEEHGVEVDPRSLTEAHVAAFAASGVTRASLGVQDFNAHVQAAIGRIQPAEVVAQAVARLRAGGVGAINLDLMYGLPKQTLADAAASAREAAALAPDRLAVFGYAHVPWFKSRQRLIQEADLPGAAARMEQAEAIRETLLACGYEAIGFDHYARPDDPLAVAARTGGMSRSFQGYSEKAEALIGLGCSAISTLPQGYAQNAPEPGAYARAIQDGRLATVRGAALSEDDRRRRAVIERLLCDFAVDLSAHGGEGAWADALDGVDALARDGLVRRDGPVLAIPDDARVFARLVAQCFDAYAHAGAARHSKAV